MLEYFKGAMGCSPKSLSENSKGRSFSQTFAPYSVTVRKPKPDRAFKKY